MDHLREDPPVKSASPAATRASSENRRAPTAVGGASNLLTLQRLAGNKAVCSLTAKKGNQAAPQVQRKLTIASTDYTKDTIAGVIPASTSNFRAVVNVLAALALSDAPHDFETPEAAADAAHGMMVQLMDLPDFDPSVLSAVTPKEPELRLLAEALATKPQPPSPRQPDLGKLAAAMLTIADYVPESFTVFVTGAQKSQTVMAVEDNWARTRPFIDFDNLKAPIKTVASGTVLVSVRSKTARFANVDGMTEGALFGTPKLKIALEEWVPEVALEDERTPRKQVKKIEPFKLSRKGGIFSARVTGFESGKASSHFDKHKEEFPELDKSENPNGYFQLAKGFAMSTGSFEEACIGNTQIRFDPKTRWFIAVNGSKVRTFYVWTPEASRDALAFGICYTLKTMRIRPDALDTDALAEIEREKVDMKGAQEDVDNWSG